jgi:hypothetical protein
MYIIRKNKGGYSAYEANIERKIKPFNAQPQKRSDTEEKRRKSKAFAIVYSLCLDVSALRGFLKITGCPKLNSYK